MTDTPKEENAQDLLARLTAIERAAGDLSDAAAAVASPNMGGLTPDEQQARWEWLRTARIEVEKAIGRR